MVIENRSHNKKPKKAIEIFGKWAEEGKDVGMEKGHAAAVNEMLKFALTERKHIGKKFSFLDLGCGNGWVVRKVQEQDLCNKAVGIDGAKQMIANAKSKASNGEYVLADLNTYVSDELFDLIHSMEVIYYLSNPTEHIKNICHKCLKTGGRLIIGLDHYYENKESHSWEAKVGTPMLMLSENDWLNIFKKSGLKNIKMWRSCTSKKWAGTLILTGLKY